MRSVQTATGTLQRLRAALILIVALGLTAGQALAANRLALVIGNDAYEEIEPLGRAVADARAYRAVLEDERGFTVYYAENAGRRAMNTRVAEFLAAIRPGDTAMIVYSGHGVQLENERRDSLYLLPTDFPNHDPGRGAERHFFDSESLNFARLAENVAARGATLRIFVLDACRNNPFGRDSGTRALGLSRGLGRIQSSSGEFVLYAAAPGEVAFDSLPSDKADSKNSLFTRAFIKHFRAGNYLEDVANDVQAEVVRLARAANVSQEPYYSDGVAGRTCLEEACGADAAKPSDADIVAEQEELYWRYCAENTEPVYCRAFIDRYPKSWRAGLARARLKVLATGDTTGSDDGRLAAVDVDKTRTATGDSIDAGVPAKGPDNGSPTDGTGLVPGDETTDTDAAGGDDGVAPPQSGATDPDDGDTPATGADAKKPDDAGDATATDADATGDAADRDRTGDVATTGSVPPKTGAEDGKAGDTDATDEDTAVAAVDPTDDPTDIDRTADAVSAEPIRPTRAQLRDAQARLTILGHSPGPIDGLMGRRTRGAIVDYQKSAEMKADGAVSEALLARLARDVPDRSLEEFYAEQAAIARSRAERERVARERAERERAARAKAARERSARTRRETGTTTRRTTTTTPRRTTTRDKDAAAAAARRAAEAKRRAALEARREAAADAARRRAAEADKPGIRLNTRRRNANKPFYCTSDPNRARFDPACF